MMGRLTDLPGVLDTLAPVFLLIALGSLLRHRRFLSEEFSDRLSQFVYWFALPSLLFRMIVSSTLHRESLETALVVILATLAMAVLGWAAAPWLGAGPRSRGAFAQAVFRGNNAYVGLPVILLAYAGHDRLEEVRSLAVLAFAPCLVLYNVLAVVVLTPREEGRGRPVPWRRVLAGIALNPLIASCVLGLLAWAGGLALPRGLDRTVDSLAALAGPGALLSLGASITPAMMRRSFRLAFKASVLKVALCPLVGLVLCAPAGLDSDARLIALVYLASPTAVSAFVMARALKGDAELAAGAVAISTLLSVASLALVLLWYGPGAA